MLAQEGSYIILIKKHPLRNKVQQVCEKFPFFLFLLPAFYYLNVAVNVYSAGMKSLLLSQFAVHFFAAIAGALVFFFFWRNYRKAALLSFMLLCFYFFYSPIVDLIKQVFGPAVFIARYTFLLPFFLLLLSFCAYRIYKSSKRFRQLFLFLNLLFFVLCLFEAVRFSTTKFGYYDDDKVMSQFRKYDGVEKPDVYLIIADEYAGQMTLKEKFGYDNSGFVNELRKRGFYVAENPKTNYNQTPFSMASLFSMDYLSLRNTEKSIISDYMLAEDIINTNSTVSFFAEYGYSILNISLFEFNKTRRVAYHFPEKKEIINYNTFYTKFIRELGYHFMLIPKKDGEEVKYDLNIIIDSLFLKGIAKDTGNAQFVYLHYLMPHHPYLFDSSGIARKGSLKLSNLNEEKRKLYYVDYLKYANKKFIKILDYILSITNRKKIIILASDHGYRTFVEKPDKKYYFNNFFSVYFPNKDYSGFYDSISTVNVFRTVLNSQFGQQLPLLKDKSIYVPD